MKPIVSLFLSAVTLSIFAGSAFAAPKAKTAEQPQAVTIAPSSSYSGGGERMGLGIQTVSSFAGSDTTLSGWFETGANGVIQPIFTVGSTTPEFEFGVGALYRHTVVGTRRLGLHMGGGAGLGTVNSGGSKFFFLFTGIAGPHFSIPDLPSVVISLDGAATIAKVEDASVNFTVGGLSPAMGLAVHYLF